MTTAWGRQAKPVIYSRASRHTLFEGAQYVLFEIMNLALRDRLGVTPEAMRANHTNL